MVKTTLLHLIRHAEGTHQLPHAQDAPPPHDPPLTAHGEDQARHLGTIFPPHETTQPLICASPLRRALQTALLAFPHATTDIHRKVLAVPDAQEASAVASDTGSEVADLLGEFEGRVDFRLCVPGWWKKEGANGVETDTLRQRAQRLRRWLRDEVEAHEVVLVTHGLFAHYLTGNIDENGEQTGEYWVNVRWRSFQFEKGGDERCWLVETEDSKKRVVDGDAALDHL